MLEQWNKSKISTILLCHKCKFSKSLHLTSFKLHHLMYHIRIVRLLHDTIDVSSADVSRFRYDTMNLAPFTACKYSDLGLHLLYAQVYMSESFGK